MKNNEFGNMVVAYDTFTIDSLGDRLWCGARDRWNDADYDVRKAVFDRLVEYCTAICDYGEGMPSITTINDIVWFECDDLFYPEEDEENEEDEKPEEDEDEEEEDEDNE